MFNIADIQELQSYSGHTETRIATVYRDENGVVVVNMKDCGEIDEYDAVDLNLVIRHAANHQKALKLIIATADFDITKKARRVGSMEDNISETIARATVVSNKLKASLLNFFNQFHNKTYPQQFFACRDEAYRWLLANRQA